MKRRVSLVIALAVSFLMMFGSIAMAGEMKAQSNAPTSEPAKLEAAIPPAQTNKADSPLLQTKSSDPVLKEGEKKSKMKEKKSGKKQQCTQCVVPGTEDECGTWVKQFPDYSYDCQPFGRAS